ncbi:conserved hypothetical protein [Verrucomicrobiia bacterium DG1235]|nr:conserved hypothetical protein [Verrucomicrobiae bacterium DG1235]
MPAKHTYPFTRREFLRATGAGAGLLSLSPFAPAFLTASAHANVAPPDKDQSILVLIQLGGGNDGLNTVVPYQDDNYYNLRPKIGLKENELLKLDDQLGLNPGCEELHRLYHEGQFSIIQNVGYPNPNRSHFRSTEIWETASGSREYLSTGWVGRFFDNCCQGSPNDDPFAVNIGNELPDTFLSESTANVFSYFGRGSKSKKSTELILKSLESTSFPDDSNANFLKHTAMNALITEERVVSRIRNYKPSVNYPQHSLGKGLQQVAAMIASGQGTRVYFVPHSGFDTHANQVQRHQNLLRQLSSSMSAFQADLQAKKLDDQVLTMTFSEFGRRPNENRSGGTDHGTAAPLFVMGSKLKGSLHGDAPKLNVGKNKDLKYTTDFRSAYSTVIDQWLGGNHQSVLGDTFQPLDFLALKP